MALILFILIEIGILYKPKRTEYYSDEEMVDSIGDDEETENNSNTNDPETDPLKKYNEDLLEWAGMLVIGKD